jgi:hypothetical protein
MSLRLLKNDGVTPILEGDPDWRFLGRTPPSGVCGQDPVTDLACTPGKCGTEDGINLTWKNPAVMDASKPTRIEVNGGLVATVTPDVTSACLLKSELPEGNFQVSVIYCSGAAATCSACFEEADGVSITGPTEGDTASPVTLTAAMTGVDPGQTATYIWEITAGTGNLDTLAGAEVKLSASDAGDVTVKVSARDGVCTNVVTTTHTVTFTQAGVGPFIRGDCNNDGQVTGQVSDAVFLLQYNFLGGPKPECEVACDVNSDGGYTGQVSDAVYLLQHNFLGGPAPLSPFPKCGTSTLATDKALGCVTPIDPAKCPP